MAIIKWLKKNCSKCGICLVTKKINIKTENIIATIVNNYSGDIYTINVDESLDHFEEDYELIINDKQIVSITEAEWRKIKYNFLYKKTSNKNNSFNKPLKKSKSKSKKNSRTKSNKNCNKKKTK